MFDLNREISVWKASFAGLRTLSRDEMDELESHLREEIETLVDQGLDVPDAFVQAVDRIGVPSAINDEFAKNERLLPLDKLALSANKVLILMVSLAALIPGVMAIRRGDALLGVHVASITSAYGVAILSAFVGIYAMVRSVYVRDVTSAFRDELVQQSRWLLGLVATLTAVGFALGACWWHARTGHFVDGSAKEIGALAVFGFAAVFYLIVKHQSISAMRQGQCTLVMSLVTMASWFVPVMLR